MATTSMTVPKPLDPFLYLEIEQSLMISTCAKHVLLNMVLLLSNRG